ncbi:uncharacterized protein PHACADRAFT_256825 [Phanerochaete carnosa HHB-10118-sp]|uniref:Uncharacterized protein n=1 Tax=Phanerochaete carnosa (strain HHB-10118-sp) TaxID=650164 RepID=K5WAA7_PHACS|nr:uncharacterized protein PHACADRAFT_256825 [Phanerochaete carnosa HHB-10118-sp]EKM55894.1 hypothetical protein PHACADRAFT_256825 [Phanerochaete carnosa HHB-10118-sp]
MSSTFTPTDVIDMNKEKNWSAGIGMMDWDNTRIVFTKRSLIEFLRYTGTTVDTNFHNIQKLPKYATFGKLSGETPAQSAEAAPSASDAVPASTSDDGGFRPTRRVRAAPGGETHDIFAHYTDDDALAGAPPRQSEEQSAQAQQEDSAAAQTRKQSGSFWDENPAPKADFRPTRRVREMPGGRDSISEIL